MQLMMFVSLCKRLRMKAILFIIWSIDCKFLILSHLNFILIEIENFLICDKLKYESNRMKFRKVYVMNYQNLSATINRRLFR